MCNPSVFIGSLESSKDWSVEIHGMVEWRDTEYSEICLN